MSDSTEQPSSSVTASSLSAYKLPKLPDSIYYIPNFISASEEVEILSRLPANKWISLSRRKLQAWPSQLTSKNVLLTAPLPNWLCSPIVDRLSPLCLFGDSDGLQSHHVDHDQTPTSPVESSSHEPNHVLVNEYLPGQGIFPHRDGEAYAPCVATISLGDAIVLDIYDSLPESPQDTSQQCRVQNASGCIIQEPRSLLITTGAAYTTLLHGIDEVTRHEDVMDAANWHLLDPVTRSKVERDGGCLVRSSTRTSLTYRRVLKTSNVASRLFGLRR